MTPREDYDKIRALNISSLADIDVSPKFFQFRRDTPREETPALAFGIAFHCSVLEPEVFAARYIVAPDFGNCQAKEGETTKEEGKANKMRRDAWRTEHATYKLLSAADGDRIENMTKALRAHPHANAALHGAAETTIRWTDSGIECKGRIDMLCPWGVPDLKTTRNPSPGAFARDCANLHYAAKLAWYHDGVIASGRLVSPDDPMIIAIQHEAPWDVACYRVSGEALESGRATYRRWLRRFLDCQASGIWPGCAPDILPLKLPNWALEAERPETEDL